MLLSAFDNIRDFCERMYWDWPEAITEHGSGYVLNYSGLTWLSGANQLWIDDLSIVNPTFLEMCVRFFRSYRAEWSIVVMPEVQPGLKEQILRAGGYIRWDSPIMLLEGMPHTLPLNRAVSIRPIRGSIMERQAQRILSEAFYLDHAVNWRLVRPEHEHDSTIYHYMAYYEDHPAAVATLTLTEDIAGIWNVGTRRMFRRKGLASALVQQICYDAGRFGYSHTMLMASSMGQPIYEKMGYTVVAEVLYMGMASF
ncbi:MAG: GNAT family N-acetyltransferase [Anaerolineae bacterium]|nr:GNAT family N-acetyltransferase [Anaerolineae bacterium]